MEEWIPYKNQIKFWFPFINFRNMSEKWKTIYCTSHHYHLIEDFYKMFHIKFSIISTYRQNIAI